MTGGVATGSPLSAIVTNWNRYFCLGRGSKGALYIVLFVLFIFSFFSLNARYNVEDKLDNLDADFGIKLAETKEFKKTAVLRGGDSVPEKPSWMIPWVQVYDDGEIFEKAPWKSRNFLTSNFFISPGLGNLMFQYASLYALALRSNFTLVVPENLLLRRSFTLVDLHNPPDVYVADRLSLHLSRSWNRTKHLDCCKYEPIALHTILPSLDAITLSSAHPIKTDDDESAIRRSLIGYFQSYKYFHQYRAAILARFDFLAPVRKLALGAIDSALKSKNLLKNETLLIGVHARRGVDLVWNMRNRMHGHTVAPKAYFDRAMAYFREKFYNYNRTLLFVMTSDDVYWARQTWRDQHDVVVLAQGAKNREVDLAILAHCQHVVMSTGTFSWWAAYLAGGHVVFYENWPRPGSALSSMFRREDFFLPEWKPMF